MLRPKLYIGTKSKVEEEEEEEEKDSRARFKKRHLISFDAIATAAIHARLV